MKFNKNYWQINDLSGRGMIEENLKQFTYKFKELFQVKSTVDQFSN